MILKFLFYTVGTQNTKLRTAGLRRLADYNETLNGIDHELPPKKLSLTHSKDKLFQ